MKIEESFVVAAPMDKVWKFITDPERVGPCIPGCQGIQITGPDSYKAAIKVGIGPIKATFNVDVQVTEERPPTYAATVTRGEEGSRASTVSATSSLELKPVDEHSTEIRYSSEVSVVGRLGKFGLGIMKKIAASMGEQFAEAVRDGIGKAQ